MEPAPTAKSQSEILSAGESAPRDADTTIMAGVSPQEVCLVRYSKMPVQEVPEWLSKWQAAYSVLFIRSATVSDPTIPIGVALLDIAENRLLFRFRDDLRDVATDESLSVLDGLRAELPAWAGHHGGTALFLMLLNSLSNGVSISDPVEVRARGNVFERLELIFGQEVSDIDSRR